MTHCAGIIGASMNGKGLIGVAPEVDIYAVKILGDKGTGSKDNMTKALLWCIENNINVISMSLGMYDDDQTLHDTVKLAYQKGIVMVAAAGNDGSSETNDNVNYPARYAEVISVAAISIDDKRWYGSSTGAEIEIAAPGNDILSTYLNSKYAFLSGTSMACPHIAGSVVLLQSKALKIYNRLLTIEEVRLLIQMYAEDLGVLGRDNNYGFGAFSFDRIK